MRRGWSYGLSVGILAAAVLIGAVAERGIGGKKDGPAKEKQSPPSGKILLDVTDALTDKDGRDPQAKECYAKTYPIELEAGTTYQIDLMSKDFDAFLRLEQAGGKYVAEDDDGGDDKNARIIYKAASSGKYVIFATTSHTNKTGKFKLTVVALAAAQGKNDSKVPDVIAFKKDGPTTIQGTIAQTDPKNKEGKHFKAYSFQAEPGNVYRFEMTGALSPFMKLFDGNGKFLKDDDEGSNGDKSLLAFVPPAAGTYRIVATTYESGQAGKFTLLATVTPIPKGPFAAKAEQLNLALGKALTIKGEITAKDPTDDKGRNFKAYAFEGQPGKSYLFAMSGQREFNPELRIVTSFGLPVQTEDRYDDKLAASVITFRPKELAMYHLIAGAFAKGATGSFTLTAAAEAGAQAQTGSAKTIAMPAFQQLFRTEIVGQLTPDDSADKDGHAFRVYTFEARANKLYIVEMNGRQFDAQLRLEDGSGKPLKSEDAFDGRYSQLVVPAGSGGTYRIIATAVSPKEYGSFSLSITERELRAPVLASVDFDRVSTTAGKLTTDDGLDNQGKYYKVFSVQAVAGKTYLVEIKGKGFAPALRLEDEKGQLLKHEHKGDPFSAHLAWTADSAATVHVIATTFKPGTHGEFTLTITERGKETGKVAGKDKGGKDAGGKDVALEFVKGQASVKGELAKSDPTIDGKNYKEFSFRGEAGKTYKIDLHSGDFDAYLFLKDNAGKTLAENDDIDPGMNLDSRIIHTVDKAGTYRILATSFDGSKTGAFTLTVVELSAPKLETLTLGAGETKIKGQLTKKDALDNKGNFHKAYAFQAEKGKAYRFELIGQDSFDPTLRIEDNKGELVKEEDFGDGKVSRIIFNVPTSGSYHLVVAAFRASSSGEYTLTAKEIEIKSAAPLSLKLENGKATIKGSLTKEDVADTDGKFFKVYELQAVKGKVYKIEMAGKDKVDPLIRIDDAKGNLVEKEDFGDGKVSRIPFAPPESATYRIVAGSFNPKETGDFTLTVAEFDPKDKGKEIPQPKQKGQDKSKETAATQPKEKVQDKESKLLEFKDTKLAGLKVTPLPLDGKDTVAGTLGAKDKKDAAGRYFQAFSFKAEAGKTYRFEMTGKGFDPSVRVEDAAGAVLEPEAFGDGKVSRSYFRAYQDGTYRIVVTSFKDGMSGDFTLSAAVLDYKVAGPQAITLEGGTAKVNGTLSADDTVFLPANVSTRNYKEYVLQAEAGKAYRIDLHSKAFDAYLILRDGGGKIVAANDDAEPVTWDARIDFKADKTGPYYITATSAAGGTGAFVLTAAEASETEKLLLRIKALPRATAADAKATVQMLQKQANDLGKKLTATDADLAAVVAEKLEAAADKPLAADFYTAVGKAMSSSADPAIKRQARAMLGAGKRLTLVGQPMQLKGTTLDGKAVDLAELKGKVVLVDFWASWCVRCKAELPNIKKLYDKYHADGFEVIGVSIHDSEKDAAKFLAKEKLPWPSIFKEGSDLADDYGVFAIPLAVLVGRDGQVISTSAHGAELQRLLEKQFGEKKK
jgi:thiol-disulfide isomerase/thioredoxin